MMPFSVAKRNRAAPDLPPLETTKSVVELLATAPVGLPPGIVTTREAAMPLPAIAGLPPLQGMVEDNMLSLRAALLGTCRCLPEALLGYRRHDHGHR